MLAVVLPILLRPGFGSAPTAIAYVDETAIGTLGAMLFGAYLLRRMTAFPGVSTIRVLLPAFGAAYAMAALIFFLARFDYSRTQFIASFVTTILWFGFVGMIEPRVRRARLLLLPFGRAENF